MRVLLVALPLLAAATVLHGQETAAADRVRLEFRWPAGTVAAVEAYRSKVKTGDADSGASHFGARYRMTLGDAPDGYVIRHDGFAVPGGTASLEQQLAGIVPSYHVSREGDFQRLADPARLRRVMDSMLAPVLAELDGKKPNARALFASLVSDEMLTMTAAQDWNVLVGNWVGAELEVGAAYESEVVETLPLFGGVELPMVYEFGATGYVACNEADAEESCVELLMSSEPKPEAATALIAKILGTMDQGLADSMADARLTIVNYVALVTHARTLIPYRLTVEKRVEIVMPGDSGGQVDLRELRFSYPGPASAPAPTADWVDASRLPLGMDSLRIYAVRGGVREEVGVVRDELVRVDFEGRPALRRTYRTTNSLYGNHHQVSHSTFPGLEALTDRNELGQFQSEVVYRADSIIGWSRLPDSACTPIALAARPLTHDAQAVDLMVRAADLRPGFRRSFEAFIPSRGSYAPMEAWVTGTATVPGVGGKPAEVWVVELGFDGLGSTMWIDRRTRALHRQVIRMGAGFEMVMERH